MNAVAANLPGSVKETAASDFPSFVSHCTVALFRSRGVDHAVRRDPELVRAVGHEPRPGCRRGGRHLFQAKFPLT